MIKRIAILAGATLLLVSCIEEKRPWPNMFTAKIYHWRIAEQNVDSVDTYDVEFTQNFYLELKMLMQQFSHIRYVGEPPGQDYWKTSAETLAQGEGDCEDLAILSYRAIHDSCLPERFGIDVRIRTILIDGKFHLFCIVYHEGKTYMVDNLAARDYVYPNIPLEEFDMYQRFM